MAYNKNKIKSLRLTIANKKTILGWSYGEVRNAETINYKTFVPSDGGLFDEVIFGPIKDYTCQCGKYSGRKNEGRRCEECGVEVISSTARRERMGHIRLVAPVIHPWYIHDSPNPCKISLLLDVGRDIEEVIYYNSYYITQLPKQYQKYYPSKEKRFISVLDPKKSRSIRHTISRIIKDEILTKLNKNDPDYQIGRDIISLVKEVELSFSFDYVFDYIKKHTGIVYDIGSSAIAYLLTQVNIKNEIAEICKNIKPSSQNFKYLVARLDVLTALNKSNTNPSDMIIEYLPVIPPEARPLIQLPTGNYTASDTNELYRKIIQRNERLAKLIADGSTSVIINNEKQLLQQAVDALFDEKLATKNLAKKQYKSITEILKGKTGLLRQNLLGKRVDFSARSVIVGGPDLKLYQVGVPADILIVLFRPFIISRLTRKIDDNGMSIEPVVSTLREAEEMIINKNVAIWPIVNELIKERPVILNRAPTLHRLGFQAFEIKMIEGKAIRLHPLVCGGFNADFDGDTMAIHLPISDLAVAEARSIMLSIKNLISPKDGKPIITPSLDILIGNYYLTIEKLDQPGQGLIFNNYCEVMTALAQNIISIHSIIGMNTNNYKQKKLKANNILVTSVGKVIFNESLANDYQFVTNSGNNIYANENDYLPPKTKINDFIAKREIQSPINKGCISKIVSELFVNYDCYTVARCADNLKENGFKYATKSGITFSYFDLPNFSSDRDKIKVECLKNIVELKDQYDDGLLTDDQRYRRVIETWTNGINVMSKSVKEYLISPKYADNSIVIMANSGARGNLSQLMQMVGMRGLMAKSYDYSRKNVNQIPRDTIENPVLASFREGMNINEFFNSSFGARKAISDVQMKTSKSGYMTRKLVDACQEVVVREDDCGSTSGIIYSDILDNDGKIIKDVLNRIIGRYAAIDIVDKDDKVIVQANELITEILANKIAKAKITNVEVRSPIYCQCKNGICKKCYGLDITTNKDPEIGTPVGIIAAQSIGEPITQINLRSFHSGGVAGGPQIAQGYERIVQLLELIQPQTYELARISSINGKITAIDIDVINERKLITISNTKNNDIEQISLDLNALLLNGIEVGATITRGQKLNFGSYSLKELLSICGIEAVRRYIIEEVQKVYLAQGININDKYVEIIVMQITNKLLVTNLNDADIIPGELLTTKKIIELNNNLFNQNKKLINAIPCLVALPNIPTYSTSFLASASFQYTKKALVKAALRGQVDNLENIKENVMLGCLIPAGTSLKTNDDLIDDAKKVVCEEYE